MFKCICFEALSWKWLCLKSAPLAGLTHYKVQGRARIWLLQASCCQRERERDLLGPAEQRGGNSALVILPKARAVHQAAEHSLGSRHAPQARNRQVSSELGLGC